MNDDELANDAYVALGVYAAEAEKLLARAIAIITRLRDQHSPRGLDAEVEAWLRDAGRAP